MSGLGWQDKAACIGHPLHLFFPDKPDGRKAVDAARAICATCPVQAECLNYVMNGTGGWQEFGVWAGTSPEERRILRRGGRPLPRRPPCGTTSGYQSHRRCGEPPCQACKTAHTQYKARHDDNRRIA